MFGVFHVDVRAVAVGAAFWAFRAVCDRAFVRLLDFYTPVLPLFIGIVIALPFRNSIFIAFGWWIALALLHRLPSRNSFDSAHAAFETDTSELLLKRFEGMRIISMFIFMFMLCADTIGMWRV